MTALWTSHEAAEALDRPPVGDWAATGVSIDSRAVAEGDLFVAIVGDRLDGHDFVADALRQGAAAALVSQQPNGVAADDPRLLYADDTTEALARLGGASRERTKASIIAVTGSVGKTGTKEMLRLALAALGECHASAGNLNNHWGAPLSLARMPAGVRFGVFELGMNHPGEICPLSLMTRPHVAVITRIAPAHTAFFDSIEQVADAKAEIFEGVEEGGAAVLNADDPLTPRLADAAKAAGLSRILYFGEADAADVRLLSAELDEAGSDVEVDVLGKTIRYRLGAPGGHWVRNSLAVLAAVAAVEGDVETAAAALAKAAPPPGRGVRRRIACSQGAFDLIDESYNASPAAVRAAFETLSLAKPQAGGRRVVVLGDMLELGPDSQREHSALGRLFGERRFDRAHGAGPESKAFIDAAPEAARGRWEATASALADHADDIAGPGDVVLVKGSLGMGMAAVIRALEGLGQAQDGGSNAL